MRNLGLLILLSLSIGCCTSTLQAQHSYFFTEEWSVNLQFGATNFYGDLSDRSNHFFSNTPFSKYFYMDRQSMAGLVLEKKFNLYFGIRGNLQYGHIKSTQESVKQYFNAHLFEYTVAGTIDFTNLIMGFDRYRLWTLYGYAGIGFTESRTWKYSMTTGAIVGTNGFGVPKREGGKYVPMTETVVPMGLGFRYILSGNWEVTAEMSLHPIHTDKLDATISDNLAWEGYGLIAIGFQYNFQLPDHWQIGGRYPRYNGKSTDPAIKGYNKRKHTIMKTKAYKRSKRSSYRTTGRRRLFKRRY